MSFVRRFFTVTSALALVSTLAGTPHLAHAAGPAVTANDAATRASLEAERHRLQGELQHVNAEIASLKRADRGMRDDYRLRARLADAEALARRLTDLDARLGRAGAADRPVDRSTLATEPRALPGDGPAELEAKADILSDEAHRLAARAESILGRARDLRARQNLRRHVGQMERDPFSPLEGSKRRALTSGSSFANTMPTGTKSGTPGTVIPMTTPSDRVGGTSNSGSVGDTNVSNGAPQSQTPGAASAPGATTPTTPVTAPAVMPAPGGAFGTQPPPVMTTTTPGATSGGGAAATTPHVGPSGVSDGTATLSVQLRDLLDPATLAEIQKLEAAGGGNGGFEALERAGAALKARADRLAQQATSLRAREHVAPRAR